MTISASRLSPHRLLIAGGTLVFGIACVKFLPTGVMTWSLPASVFVLAMLMGIAKSGTA